MNRLRNILIIGSYKILKFCSIKLPTIALILFIDIHSEPQLIPKLLLQVSIQELHNSMVSPSEEVLLKEEIYSDNNIIISDSTLRSIIPPQLNKMSTQHKVVCGCDLYICQNYSFIITIMVWSLFKEAQNFK